MLMCRDLARIASDYIDGELTTTENLSVKLHLLMCRHCRSFIGNLRTSIELLKGHSGQQLNEDFVRQIDQRIEAVLKERE